VFFFIFSSSTLFFVCRPANGAGCHGFYGAGCFMGCVWMGRNGFLYLMGWGGLGIRQMRVGAGWGARF
jgi:hypothetical protein